MPLTVGVAGLHRGRGHINVFAQRDDCRVVAVCDIDGRLAQAVAEEYDIPHYFDSYEALVDFGPDIIVVATPAPLHAEHCIDGRRPSTASARTCATWPTCKPMNT